MNQNNTDWAITADIYDVVESVDNLRRRYIEDEDESALSVGIFGFLGDTEAKKIQSAIMATGILGNEMFPQRAKLDKNVITHAMYCNVDSLHAVPAHISINFGIRESDCDEYMSDNEFRFDRRCPVYVGKYEFHFDYDIVLTRTKKPGSDKYLYNAYYDMSNPNLLSSIKNPYLRQPYRMNFQNEAYIFFQATLRQVSIETPKDKAITNSIIDNKSFSFTFENQMAHFDVYVTESNGKRTRLLPLLYGSPVELGVDKWCWYLYINDHTIRVGFDPTSFIPGLNANIEVEAQTTLGFEGNFNHKMDIKNNTFFLDFESEYYNYKKITCYGACATDSTDGEDKKSVKELRSLIPKFAMSRGYITTETDLNNYFSLISTDKNIIKVSKKEDNQLNRIWYCYLLMKDAIGNVIPTNTINIKIDPADKEFIKDCEQEEFRKFIPAGTLLRYDRNLKYARPVKEVPTPFTEEYFKNDGIYYYRTIYNIIINEDPLYAAYYMSIVNTDGYFEYQYVNPNLFMGFVTTTNHFERYLLSQKDEYRLSFTMQQSINEDLDLYYERMVDGGEIEVVNNMKVFLVLYNGEEPYRYEEAVLTNYSKNDYKSDWLVTLHTDDDFDSHNKLKLLDLYEIGYSTKNYGYFEHNCKAAIYIFAKFDEEYGRDSADKMIPGLEGYSLVNVYNLADGLTLFHKLTRITNTRIRVNVSTNKQYKRYDISGVPVVGEHYFMNEEAVIYYIHELLRKKAYIDYCLLVLENNMDIDFKFFNTYGYSLTYHMGDRDQTSIGDLDTVQRWRVKLRNNNDISTKKRLIQYIKEYTEDLNKSGADLHFPNLIHDLKEEFGDLIIYIEYMNFNGYRLGINHIELRDIDDPHIVPEFISVRNEWNADKTALIPCIDMEVVIQ